ncbi:MAG: DUF3192 domain-containing protein [Bacteroidetes bacterium]|nr:DUF3192 domain-containing protein [Bacteroidota bacterium]MBU1423954.1 DUF3192 domain-containing protein [Bacteroidota bacterium]
MRSTLVIAFLLLLFVGGCAQYGVIAERNNKNLLRLEIGDTKSKVLEVIGEPHRNEKYQIEGRNYDVWFYRTAWTADDRETDDEFTPVVIIDGKVAGWGRNYYDTTIKVKQDIKIEHKN